MESFVQTQFRSHESVPSSEQTPLEQVSDLMEALTSSSFATPLDPIVREHFQTGGKMLRAQLALQAAVSIGLEPHTVVPVATACELLHNATLVHDDVQDGDRLRRGKPTVWARHGKAQAINAGDLLLMMPQLALEELNVSYEKKWRIHQRLTRRAMDTVRGQSAEMELLSSRSFDRTIYERVVEAKTGALISLPVEAVATLADWNETEIDALASVFRTVGRLFQMQDDVLDLYGQKGRANRGNDLREGKVSILVIDHMESNPDDRSALIRVLDCPRDETSTEDVSFWIERFAERGTLSAVLQDIKDTSERVLEQPALRRLPGLYAVTNSLVERMLAPIGHLFPGKTL